MPSALVSNGSRVLTPAESDAMRAVIAKPSNRLLFDLLTFTGLRLVEVRQIVAVPNVYDPERRSILVRSGKALATQRTRNVRLCDRGVAAVEGFLERPKVPGSSSAWQQNLIRWARAARLVPIPGKGHDAYNPCGLTVRTTRKTLESWLLAAFPDRATEVALSQGHTEITALKHYLNLNFTPAERAAIAEQVEGWPIAMPSRAHP